MKRILACIMTFIVLGCARLPLHYVALEDQTPLSLADVLTHIKDKRVIFVGEGHTAGSDHLFQFEVVKHLNEEGKSVAIAFEMFPFRLQGVLDDWIEGYIDEYDFVDAYYSVWQVPYRYYGSIFTYARQERIPLFAINAERGMIGNVAKGGVYSLPEDFLRKIKFTSCFEDTEYTALLKNSEDMIGHDATFPFFCNAQRLRDAIMAYNISRIIERDNYTVVVILGAAHASKAAVPRMLEKHVSVSYTVLVPQSYEHLIGKEPNSEIADYLWY